MAAGETSNFQTPPMPEKLSPEEFARDILRVDLWYKQAEVLSALPDHQRVAVKSGNGLGKGFCASVLVQCLNPYLSPRPSLSCSPVPRL